MNVLPKAARAPRCAGFPRVAPALRRVAPLGLAMFLASVLGPRVRAADKPPAQTPATAAAGALTKSNASPAFVSGSIEIFADRSEFDIRRNVIVYQGNVRAVEPKMTLVCEQLTVKVPRKGERVESILAETNVVVDLTDEKGQKVRGTGDKAVYTFKATTTETNEVVELHGSPLLDTDQGTLAGDVITYDRVSGKVRATNQRMVVRQDLTGGTNKTHAATNRPPAGMNPRPGPPPNAR